MLFNMKLQLSLVTLLFLTSTVVINASGEDKKSNKNIYDLTVLDMSGKEVKLSSYKGKVLLIVNVASICGYTPQYEGLQKLYDTYKDRGFEILAFPCNDFGGQEPGSKEEIMQFCTTNYSVTFRVLDKVKVLGNNKSDLYKRLTSNIETGREDIKWNFEKFLISKEGKIISRFKSAIKPLSEELVNAIEKELGNP